MDMGKTDIKKQTRIKRKRRIRKKIFGHSERPRLCVFRSARHIYAQVIDDSSGKTVASSASLENAIKTQEDIKGKLAVATLVGKAVGERAINEGVKKVVFDRNGFLYHGRVKAVSEGAREAGLIF